METTERSPPRSWRITALGPRRDGQHSRLARKLLPESIAPFPRTRLRQPEDGYDRNQRHLAAAPQLFCQLARPIPQRLHLCDFVYVRLDGSKELYANGYTKEELDWRAARIKLWVRGEQPEDAHLIAPCDKPLRRAGRDGFAYFDNDAKRAHRSMRIR